MITLGVPTEIKDQEYRVALTPHGVREVRGRGHRVLVQSGAGEGSGFSDEQYRQAGAVIMPDAKSTFDESGIIVKVKEPQPVELTLLRKEHVLFTYLHLAASKVLTEALLKIGCTAIGYETTQDATGHYPLLRPMSEIAGRMSVQIGAQFLEKHHGGGGILLSGVPGVSPGKVVILGSGVVGASAAKIAVGMGAEVTVLSVDLWQLREMDQWYQGRIRTVASNQTQLELHVPQADLVIGAVYLPAARTPQLISRTMLAQMKAGSVFVDVSVDQGGCAETTRPTTHTDPVYVVDGVLHYAVPNIPGIVPHTSTLALTNATLPFIVQLLDDGLDGALHTHDGLRKGVNILMGRLVSEAVASAHGLPWEPVLPLS